MHVHVHAIHCTCIPISYARSICTCKTSSRCNCSALGPQPELSPYAKRVHLAVFASDAYRQAPDRHACMRSFEMGGKLLSFVHLIPVSACRSRANATATPENGARLPGGLVSSSQLQLAYASATNSPLPQPSEGLGPFGRGPLENATHMARKRQRHVTAIVR